MLRRNSSKRPPAAAAGQRRWVEAADGSGFIRAGLPSAATTDVTDINEQISEQQHSSIGLGAFPCSPIKAEPATPSNDESARAVGVESTPLTLASSSHDGYHSANNRKDGNAAATPIPYEKDELIDQSDDEHNNLPIISSSALTPVKEDCSPKAPVEDHPVQEEKRRGWVGIGLGGETIALSVRSVGSERTGYDDSSIICPDDLCGQQQQQQQQQQQRQPIPRAIDFQRFESDKLPKVKKTVEIDSSSILSNISSNSYHRSRRSIAHKVLHDIDELSVDLSVIEEDGVASIASVMTKEDCVDLAKRLEKMERQLLDLAGETHKEDAMRALAKATHRQAKRADKLQKKVLSQEKKIGTLNDLCQRLLDGKRQDEELRSTSKKEMNELRDKNAALTLELHRSESRNEELSSKMKEMSNKVSQMEEESVRKSRLLWNSYSQKKNANKIDTSNSSNNRNPSQVDYDEKMHNQSLEGDAEDKATIQRLQKEMAAMAESHKKKERRSASKIKILMEIKEAMEEQIRLLEEGDADDDASV